MCKCPFFPYDLKKNILGGFFFTQPIIHMCWGKEKQALRRLLIANCPMAAPSSCGGLWKGPTPTALEPILCCGVSSDGDETHVQLTKQEVMLEQSAGDSGLWEGKRCSKPSHSFKWFTHGTHPRTNLLLFFAIENFGEEIVSFFKGLRVKFPFELRSNYCNC